MVLKWTHTKKFKEKKNLLFKIKKKTILSFDFELKIHKFQFLAPHNELQTQTNKQKKPYKYLTFRNKFFNLKGGY
jgi:hypothetical protein